LAQAVLERIPAAGHLSILENPATFNAAVARFLERFFP
jgi:pimeloyl-ACP methyl ester carboxylesterase